MAIKLRGIRNIHFTNCRFEKNASTGLQIGNDYFVVDEDGTITEAYSYDNISLTNCSFNNRGWNLVLSTAGPTKKPPEFGGVTNFRMIGCLLKQGVPVDELDPVIASCQISVSGNGCILGCDFIGQDVRKVGNSQIIFDDRPFGATWRVIGNHFKSSSKNNPAIDIVGKNSNVTIIGNHFEFMFDDPPSAEAKRPFVRLKDGDPSRHVIHSNIGDGQVYLDIGGIFSWIDVSPGIPVTLGSPTTKGRDVEVVDEDLTNKFKVISFGTDLEPSLYSGGSTYLAKQVDYQVEVTFQWDAGSWWVSDKQKNQFTINWTNPTTEDDVNPKLLDWTLHL